MPRASACRVLLSDLVRTRTKIAPAANLVRIRTILYKKPLDLFKKVDYIITMTTQTTFEPCNQCGNQALLLEGNKGTCLNCLFPAPEREFEGQFLEGCECENCTKHFEKVLG